MAENHGWAIMASFRRRYRSLGLTHEMVSHRYAPATRAQTGSARRHCARAEMGGRAAAE